MSKLKLLRGAVPEKRDGNVSKNFKQDQGCEKPNSMEECHHRTPSKQGTR